MMRLGELLVQKRLISRVQLDQAVSHQRHHGGLLGQILIRLGMATTEDVTAMLAWKYRVPAVDLKRTKIDPWVIALVPGDAALRHRCLPTDRTITSVTLAMVDPTDLAALDEIRFLTGLQVNPVLASESALVDALYQYYDSSRASPPTRGIGERVESGSVTLEVLYPGRPARERTSERGRAVELCHTILTSAVRRGARAIHIESYSGLLRLRFRIDSELRCVYQGKAHPRDGSSATSGRCKICAMISYLKAAAGIMPPCGKWLQEGALNVRIQRGPCSRDVQFLLTSIITSDGEKLTLRLPREVGLTTAGAPAAEGVDAFPGWTMEQRHRALLDAARRGDVRLVNALLFSRPIVADQKNQDSVGNTAMAAAAYGGHTEVLLALLRAGVSANEGFGAWRESTALLLAAEEGHVDTVRSLLDAGALGLCSALRRASRRGQAETVSVLLEAGRKGVAEALVDAAAEGHPNTVQILLGHRPDERAKTVALEAAACGGAPYGRFPLSVARRAWPSEESLHNDQQARIEIVRMLITSGADVNGKNDLPAQVTALMLASQLGRATLVHVLLEAGAAPNAVAEDGRTALMAAMDGGSDLVTELLLKAGARVGTEVLGRMMEPGQRGHLKVLRAVGARVRWNDEDKIAALKLAEREGHIDIAAFLRQAGAAASEERHVVEKILTAFRERTRFLDLSNLGLRSLPSEMGHLGHIERLDLTGNQLQGLPAEMRRLSKLKSLTLSWNRLRGVPDVISELSKLEELNIAGNELIHLPFWLTSFARLRRLVLDNNRLESLPTGIGDLSHLEILSVVGNKLTWLPAEIRQLRSLKELNLSRNRLSKLPPEVGDLRRLQVLRLAHNRIWRLPPEIGRLESLCTLDLNLNRLRELPLEIGNLKALRVLKLAQNSLTGFPDELFVNGQLEDLKLAGNPLKNPPGIALLERLESVDVEWKPHPLTPGTERCQ